MSFVSDHFKQHIQYKCAYNQSVTNEFILFIDLVGNALKNVNKYILSDNDIRFIINHVKLYMPNPLECSEAVIELTTDDDAKCITTDPFILVRVLMDFIIFRNVAAIQANIPDDEVRGIFDYYLVINTILLMNDSTHSEECDLDELVYKFCHNKKCASLIIYTNEGELIYNQSVYNINSEQINRDNYLQILMPMMVKYDSYNPCYYIKHTIDVCDNCSSDTDDEMSYVNAAKTLKQAIY